MGTSMPSQAESTLQSADSALSAEIQENARLDQGLTWEYCGPPPKGHPLTIEMGISPTSTTPIAISADGANFFRLEDKVLLQGRC